MLSERSHGRPFPQLHIISSQCFSSGSEPYLDMQPSPDGRDGLIAPEMLGCVFDWAVLALDCGRAGRDMASLLS